MGIQSWFKAMSRRLRLAATAFHSGYRGGGAIRRGRVGGRHSGTAVLEQRQMLTATAYTYVDAFGYLRVDGSENNDSCAISDVTLKGVPHVQVKLNGKSFNFGKDSIPQGGVLFFGMGGNDKCELKAGGLRLWATGGAGNDTLTGGGFDDVLVGGEGNDLLSGGNGNDKVWGDTETFNNDISSESGSDTIYGGSGNDTLLGGNSRDSISGNDGDDEIRGEHGDDVLVGGMGNDLIYGDRITGDQNSEADLFETAVGDDFIYGDEGNDTIFGGARADTIQGGSGDDVLIGGMGGDSISAGSGRDRVWGGFGMDRIFGEADPDTLNGGDGSDVMYGGAGYDYLNGDNGDDFLDGEADDAYYNGGTGLDTAANQPIINGLGYGDVVQEGSNSCWFLASLGAMTTLGATGNGTNLNSYLKYVGNGNYQVRLYQKKKWRTVTVTFEGIVSTHSGDAAVTKNGDTGQDNLGCEGEFWATVIHRGMNKLYGVDYKSASAVRNADYGAGAGKGGYPHLGLELLGNTTATYETQSLINPFNTEFLNRMRSLLHRTSSIQPMIASSKGSPGSNKVVGGHAYQIIEIGSNGVIVRNPWGVDGGVRPSEDVADEGLVVLTPEEFKSSFDYVAYTKSPVNV